MPTSFQRGFQETLWQISSYKDMLENWQLVSSIRLSVISRREEIPCQSLNKPRTGEPLPIHFYTPSALALRARYFSSSQNVPLERHIISKFCLFGGRVPSEVVFSPSPGLTSLVTWQPSADARKTGLPHASSDRT